MSLHVAVDFVQVLRLELRCLVWNAWVLAVLVWGDENLAYSPFLSVSCCPLVVALTGCICLCETVAVYWVQKFNSQARGTVFVAGPWGRIGIQIVPKLTHSLSTSDITAIPEKQEGERNWCPWLQKNCIGSVVRPKDTYIKEESDKKQFGSQLVEFWIWLLDSTRKPRRRYQLMGEIIRSSLFEQRKDTENMEDCQNLLKPCSLCEKTWREHYSRRTGHLVTCFHCARRLKEGWGFLSYLQEGDSVGY